MKFQIGQKAWWATWDVTEAYVICPDCQGTGHIRFLNPDDSIGGAIDCAGCTRGYDAPTGKVRVYERRPRATLVTINGMNVEATKIEYHTTGSYLITEDRLFDLEADALAFAALMAAAADHEERERIARKEKDEKSWAWHVHYHRSCIRRAQKEIAYHSAKLSVASVKAKKPVPAWPLINVVNRG